ncbi:MAG: Flagellar assembly protein FliH/Type secretion system HrpE [Solirubrobacterales bacterium]|nr:Flagellar assembly protein FliH/Type secretion system HrpE [Solirubrobacterales bacterium]
MTTDFALPALTPPPELLLSDEPTMAANLISVAQAEADAIRQAARAEGHAAGLAAAGEDVRLAVAALSAGTLQVTEVAAELAAELEEQAVTLGLAIAQQALGGALEVQPERVVDVVRGALRRLVDRERVTLLVHPDDLECVRASAPTLLGELGGIEHCEVQAERRVSRGGAMVRTGEGEVDATLETKLARAREVVEQALTEHDPARDDAAGD